MKKFLNLNTWSWVSLFGYLEVISLFIVIFLMIKGDPSGALGYAFICILLGKFYLILPIILFICEFCGVTIRNIVKNKIVFTVGIIIYVLLVLLFIVLHNS